MVNHQRRMRAAMESWWGNAAFYNYADRDLTDWMSAYWGSNNALLLTVVKCQYDPGEMFSTKAQNIPLPSNCTCFDRGAEVE